MDPQRILTEDNWFLAVHKKAGEIVIPDRFGKEPKKNILINQVGDYLRAKGHKPDETGRDLYPVHRLDRNTSGVVLFAKHEKAHKALSQMFENRKMDKTYWAFTVGEAYWDASKVNIALRRAEGKLGRGRSLVDLSEGKEADTDFKVLERFSGVSLIEAKPHTGKLHQIRVHLRVLGSPLIVDDDYGFTDWLKKNAPALSLKRTPLHARALRFVHPHSSNWVEITCPLDQDLEILLSELRARATKVC